MPQPKNKKLIIIEGPRATGKTTLAASLQAALADLNMKAVVLKVPRNYDWMPEKLHSSVTGMAAIIETIAQVDTTVILDRFIGTEYVMRTADNTMTSEMRDTLMQLEVFLYARIPQHIQLCLYGKEEIRMARVPDRKPEISVTDDSIDELWINWYARTILKSAFINTESTRASVLNAALSQIV